MSCRKSPGNLSYLMAASIEKDSVTTTAVQQIRSPRESHSMTTTKGSRQRRNRGTVEFPSSKFRKGRRNDEVSCQATRVHFQDWSRRSGSYLQGRGKGSQSPIHRKHCRTIPASDHQIEGVVHRMLVFHTQCESFAVKRCGVHKIIRECNCVIEELLIRPRITARARVFPKSICNFRDVEIWSKDQLRLGDKLR